MNPFVVIENLLIEIIIFVISVALCTAVLQSFLSKKSALKKRKERARKEYLNAMDYRKDGVVGDVKEEVEENRINNLKESYNKKDKSYAEKLIMDGGAYVAKAKMMSASEQGVYKILEKAYGEKYHIFCQVRVVDIIQPNITKYQTTTREYKSLFWQISQWHFDYVMCDKSDFSIFCALELDDASHERADRVRRDRILNAVCKDAGLDLKRMKLNHENKRVEVVS